MIEHRHSPRIPVSSKAVLYQPHGYIFPCVVENISADGIYIRTLDNRFNKGSLVEVAIEDAVQRKKSVKIRGLVVHKNQSGIGLLCTDAGLQNYFRKHYQINEKFPYATEEDMTEKQELIKRLNSV